MGTKTLLEFSCLLELATGMALVAAPNLVAGLLLSSSLSPTGEVVARVCGFGLLSLAIACWPRGEGNHTQAMLALSIYNLGVGCYLTYLRISGEFFGIFLLAAGVPHLLLGVIRARPAYLAARNRP